MTGVEFCDSGEVKLQNTSFYARIYVIMLELVPEGHGYTTRREWRDSTRQKPWIKRVIGTLSLAIEHLDERSASALARAAARIAVSEEMQPEELKEFVGTFCYMPGVFEIGAMLGPEDGKLDYVAFAMRSQERHFKGVPHFKIDEIDGSILKKYGFNSSE